LLCHIPSEPFDLIVARKVILDARDNLEMRAARRAPGAASGRETSTRAPHGSNRRTVCAC